MRRVQPFAVRIEMSGDETEHEIVNKLHTALNEIYPLRREDKHNLVNGVPTLQRLYAALANHFGARSTALALEQIAHEAAPLSLDEHMAALDPAVTSTTAETSADVPDLLDAIRCLAAWQPAVPERKKLIGQYGGFPVYVDQNMPVAMVEIHAPSVVRFRVDHPYIIGTSLEKAARKALGE